MLHHWDLKLFLCKVRITNKTFDFLGFPESYQPVLHSPLETGESSCKSFNFLVISGIFPAISGSSLQFALESVSPEIFQISGKFSSTPLPLRNQRSLQQTFQLSGETGEFQGQVNINNEIWKILFNLKKPLKNFLQINFFFK